MGAIDLTDQRFGKLLVICRASPPTNQRGLAVWRCRCDCGKQVDVTSNNLRTGNTRSCGCSRRGSHITHGDTVGRQRTKLYSTWLGIHNRCTNPNTNNYHNYGARGIKMCDEWQDFAVFKQWAIEAGALAIPGLTIDRMDVDGDYEPSNCRWITRGEQQRNKRNNHYETFDGRTMILADWAEEYNVPARVLSSRLSHGWDFERALTTPIRAHKPYQCSKQPDSPQ